MSAENLSYKNLSKWINLDTMAIETWSGYRSWEIGDVQITDHGKFMRVA